MGRRRVVMGRFRGPGRKLVGGRQRRSADPLEGVDLSMEREPSPNYFDVWAKRLGIDDAPPSELEERAVPTEALRLGPTGSPLGGKIVIDLRRLTVDELSARADLAEKFLARPAVRYPADEALAARKSAG